VKVVKNKMAPPFKEVEFDILYGTGISKEGDLIDLASEANVVDKSGAWFSFAGERIGQGRENAKQFLLDHPEVSSAIEAKLLAHFAVRRIGVEEPMPAAVEATDAAGDKSKGQRSVPAVPPPTASARTRSGGTGGGCCRWVISPHCPGSHADAARRRS
jgi:recombination protein RecA